MKVLLVILAISLATPAGAQTAIDTAAREHIEWATSAKRSADWLSNGVVTAALVTPCLGADRRCWQREAIRVGLAVGAAELTKAIVRRERPDRSDRKSFFSEHTTLACVGGFSGKRQAIGAALCAGAGYLRMAAGKHWFTDVLVGAGVGLALSRVNRRGAR